MSWRSRSFWCRCTVCISLYFAICSRWFWKYVTNSSALQKTLPLHVHIIMYNNVKHAKDATVIWKGTDFSSHTGDLRKVACWCLLQVSSRTRKALKWPQLLPSAGTTCAVFVTSSACFWRSCVVMWLVKTTCQNNICVELLNARATGVVRICENVPQADEFARFSQDLERQTREFSLSARNRRRSRVGREERCCRWREVEPGTMQQWRTTADRKIETVIIYCDFWMLFQNCRYSLDKSNQVVVMKTL